jgi:hypothetical protein
MKDVMNRVYIYANIIFDIPEKKDDMSSKSGTCLLLFAIIVEQQ